ncbi:MAG: DNA alkylation repair protein [Rhizobiaceae bacterium]
MKRAPTAEQYIEAVTKALNKCANPDVAPSQQAYMKNHFEFFGIKSPERKLLQQAIRIDFQLPSKADAEIIARHFWEQPQRECQYLAQELLFKYKRQFEKSDVELFQFMICTKSWWDTIDFIAPNLIGAYFKAFPEQRDPCLLQWLDSGNIWLQRSAVLFQLKYKSDLDTKCLAHVIGSLLGSKEFFINKSIGWVLREYGKTNPKWVINFVEKTPLEKLSQKEAMKILSTQF